MLDPTLLGALTAALERTVNSALRYDPGTRAALAGLAGRVIEVESTLPPLTFYLLPREDLEAPLEIQAYCEQPVDTRLKGSLPAILALAFGERHSLADSGVEVYGNTSLLSELQHIFKNIDIDWEEPLTAVLGTGLGHPLAELMRGQWRWLSGWMSKAQSFAGEYVTEELRATPSRAELTRFYQQVDDLRSDTERLGARVQQLTARRGKSAGD